jgi:hypothetical protein
VILSAGIAADFQKWMAVPITNEQRENVSLICLEGDVDISSAMEVKNILINALASNK